METVFVEDLRQDVYTLWFLQKECFYVQNKIRKNIFTFFSINMYYIQIFGSMWQTMGKEIKQDFAAPCH